MVSRRRALRDPLVAAADVGLAAWCLVPGRGARPMDERSRLAGDRIPGSAGLGRGADAHSRAPRTLVRGRPDPALTHGPAWSSRPAGPPCAIRPFRIGGAIFPRISTA